MDEVLQTRGQDESAPTTGRKSGRSLPIEIITRGERRRSWTAAQKREIVAESLGAELTPAEVARKYGVSVAATARPVLLDGSVWSAAIVAGAGGV